MISFTNFFKKVYSVVTWNVFRVAVFLHGTFLKPARFSITHVELEYNSTRDTYDGDSPFWKKESRFWDTDFPENSANITRFYKKRESLLPYPDGVDDVRFQITYKHDGKVYTYVTGDINYSWPPKKMPGMNPTIREAFAVTRDGDHDDVTERVRRFAGPYSDFHGERVRLTDLFAEDYTFCKMTNMLGQSKVVHFGDSFSREKLWT